MFLGTHGHSLDMKGRVILPSKFRDQLAEGAVITKVLDGCLAIYTAEEFEKVAQEMQESAKRGATERNVVRSFAGGAAEVDPDKQGRITIPSSLREFAHLDRDVVVAGVFNRIEIWDATKWGEVNQEGEASLQGAQPGLSDLGF
ncbi:MAG TPA: division/cell wall cluster transcriptional repressor MraZ [Acidimicrobiales bacterium]|nr:division/cell wall cluster transcriptional repressor MraZ [Acidimicrobiales bacterium]